MPLICFASPKGGVGKTTLSANIAHELQRNGRRVLAIDFDPQNALRLHFGMSMRDGAGWSNGMPAQVDWQSALRSTSSGVTLLPYGSLDLHAALTLDAAVARQPDLIRGPMQALLSDPDLTIVADLPPGPSATLALLAPMATVLLCVLKAEVISAALLPEIESGRFLGQAVGSEITRRLRVVINEVDMASRPSRAAAEAVARHAGWRLLGAVTRDEALMEALACQKLLLETTTRSQAADDIREVTQALSELLPQTRPASFQAWG
ncbi:cellulose biosynthesis protein BcsQ [Roseomonas elaeocarpi]|uniref:Cellulose biosynthesis protein BcsQ n=1 Tax=Roseomonas elaeocarpi TaxID=907779 RepID=A0ABV6JVI5_9PROT